LEQAKGYYKLERRIIIVVMPMDKFKEVEKHYHTTFKEALAVKNGIKKFDFHLRGHQF